MAVYELDEYALREGHNLVNKYLDVYKRCRDSDQWEGYPQEVVKLSLPAWVFKTIDLSEIPLEAVG